MLVAHFWLHLPLPPYDWLGTCGLPCRPGWDCFQCKPLCLQSQVSGAGLLYLPTLMQTLLLCGQQLTCCSCILPDVTPRHRRQPEVTPGKEVLKSSRLVIFALRLPC